MEGGDDPFRPHRDGRQRPRVSPGRRCSQAGGDPPAAALAQLDRLWGGRGRRVGGLREQQPHDVFGPADERAGENQHRDRPGGAGRDGRAGANQQRAPRIGEASRSWTEARAPR